MTSREYLQALGYEKFQAEYAILFRVLNQPQPASRGGLR